MSPPLNAYRPDSRRGLTTCQPQLQGRGYLGGSRLWAPPPRAMDKLCMVTQVSDLLPWSCRGWPAVSCRSWLWDKVNLFPWNCSVTGVSGWATRLGGPAREASWAILTTSPPAKMWGKGNENWGSLQLLHCDYLLYRMTSVTEHSVIQTLSR